jgi:hypothetical protein
MQFTSIEGWYSIREEHLRHKEQMRLTPEHANTLREMEKVPSEDALLLNALLLNALAVGLLEGYGAGATAA